MKMSRRGSKKKKYMSVKEMGDLLGIKKSERYWLLKKDYFKVIEAGGKMWVEMESFEKWYASQTRYHKITGEEPGREVTAVSLSVKEIAALLKTSEGSVYELIHKGRIPVIWEEGKIRILRKDFWGWYDCQIKYRLNKKDIPKEKGKDYLISVPELAGLLNISTGEVYRLAGDPEYDSCFTTTLVRDRIYISYRDFGRFLKSQDKYRYDPKRDPAVVRADGRCWLNIRQACWHAGVSKTTLINWCRQERFPVRRAGKNVRIPLTEFEEWLKKREEEGRKWHP